ncbi:MAG: helix-turn-helix transcriptional regulator [Clostridiales Family XIII bacterium]|nr:helix-turn-helix transcriptional regulator [Clostridiales Family XIII bacterium]
MGTFGRRIRALRVKKGLSQKAFAELVGIRPATLSRYENDKRTYRGDSLIKMADVLDTSIDYLLCRTNINISTRHLTFDTNMPGDEISFFDAYSRLNFDDQNLMMERLKTIYDIRNKDSKLD